MQANNRIERTAGYSLVEVTLALLVVAIGLTATFALFPEGMRATRAAVNDTEVGLFADYVFSTLSVTAAAKSGELGAGAQDARTADIYASRVLADTATDKKVLNSGDVLSRFYWIARNNDLGTGDWNFSSTADFWSTAFTYRLRWEKMNKGNNRDTYFAVLQVWPGEWMSIKDETKFPPYVFYREIIPYPDM
jgi:Tfp pilus assembly protein PilV